MNHSLYTVDDQKINETILRDLARRSRAGGIYYILAFWGTVIISSAAMEHPGIIAAFSTGFIVLQICRLVLARRVLNAEKINVEQCNRCVGFIFNTSAIIWAASSGWIYYINPTIDLVVTVNLTIATGISIGGSTVLAPSYHLLRNYCLLMCALLASSAAVFLNSPGNWVISILIILYGSFIFITAKQQNKAYWKTLNDNLKLSAQAEELEKAKNEAEVAGQAKADFLAAMTHEIRTPMNGVLGMTQLLAAGDLSNEHQKQVAVINNAGRTLLHIIDNILDYSKISAGKQTLEKHPFNPKTVVSDVCLLLSNQAEEKGLKLYCNAGEVPDFLEGDSYKLHQILYNLLGNALKFTHQGEISITLSSSAGTQEGNRILSIAVKDTGAGISPEDQEKIFEQFHQVSQFSPDIRGTGLGLSITQRIVELMGGKISLESTVGHGTTFTVDIPFSIATQKPKRKSEKDALAGQKISIPNNEISTHILLAEDNKTNQMICEKFLLALGCRVDIAETGKTALDKFNSENHYDAIFMDCNMPEMDGFSATRNIRQIEKDKGLRETPIIALTAHVQDEVKEQCLASGMNAFLSKPFLLDELKAAISEIQIGASHLHENA